MCRGSNNTAYEGLKVESQELRNQQRLLITQLQDIKVRPPRTGDSRVLTKV